MKKKILVFEELLRFKDIKFLKDKHVYRTEWGEEFGGASSLLKDIRPPFNADFWAYKKAKEEGITKEEKKKEWSKTNAISKERGKLFHTFAEDYLNRRITNPFLPDKLMDQFKRFCSNTVDTEYYIPIASEIIIGDLNWKIGGIVDQLFYSKVTQKYVIFDWKTNNKFTIKNKWKKKFKKPLNHLEDTKYNYYSLQVSLYRLIIERNTSLSMATPQIVWFNEKNKDYMILPAQDFREEIKVLINEYRK